jgi:hypothetical protein
MPKRPTSNHPLLSDLLQVSPATFFGNVHDPDVEAAVEMAIKQFKVRPNERDSLVRRRDGQ